MTLNANNIDGLVSSVNSSISNIGQLRRPTVSDVDGIYALTEEQKKIGIDVVYPKEFLRKVLSDKDAINFVVEDKDKSGLLSASIGYPSMKHKDYRKLFSWTVNDGPNSIDELPELVTPKGFHIEVKATSLKYAKNGLYRIINTIQKCDAFHRGLTEFYLESIPESLEIHKREGFKVLRPVIFADNDGSSSDGYFMSVNVTNDCVNRSLDYLTEHLKKYQQVESK